MSIINRRAALSALAAALPASLTAKTTGDKPFTIPPPPAPAGASEKLLRAIQFEYREELRSFAFQLESAQAVYAKYPGLVKSSTFPQACFDALGEDGLGGPPGDVRDSFLRPSELIAEAEETLHYAQAEKEKMPTPKAEPEQRVPTAADINEFTRVAIGHVRETLATLEALAPAT